MQGRNQLQRILMKLLDMHRVDALNSCGEWARMAPTLSVLALPGLPKVFVPVRRSHEQHCDILLVAPLILMPKSKRVALAKGI